MFLSYSNSGSQKVTCALYFTSWKILSMILPTLPALTACGLITQQVQLSKVAVTPPPFLIFTQGEHREKSMQHHTFR